jgi:hypothetical protein
VSAPAPQQPRRWAARRPARAAAAATRAAAPLRAPHPNPSPQPPTQRLRALPNPPTPRSKTQIVLDDCDLVVPYDEFVCLQHIFFDLGAPSGRGATMDMFYYFQMLLDEHLKGFRVRRGVGGGVVRGWGGGGGGGWGGGGGRRRGGRRRPAARPRPRPRPGPRPPPPPAARAAAPRRGHPAAGAAPRRSQAPAPRAVRALTRRAAAGPLAAPPRASDRGAPLWRGGNPGWLRPGHRLPRREPRLPHSPLPPADHSVTHHIK